MTIGEAIIYLRLSDFRDEADTTFEERAAELREFAADLELHVLRVAVENDLNGNGKPRGASAYKTPVSVRTASGLVTFRTNRPVFQGVARDLQDGAASVLIVSDDSRIARNERDGLDLIDACKGSRASVVVPDDDGGPRWILTNGGTPGEISRFKDRIADARRYSDEIAAKVRKGRKRWAGKSYQGGRRPFGYRVAQDTEQHQRNLEVDEAEAAEIRKAASDLLRGVSLKAVIRDLKERHVPTVTGTEWTTRSLRDAVLKPSAAGLAVRAGELVPAPWPHILERDEWERLGDLLRDPARRTTDRRRGIEPRWLVSVFATCGVCGRQLKVGGAGRGRGPAYVGSECGHIRRDAVKVDELVRDRVFAILERPGADDLLRPPPRVSVDEPKLRAERRRIIERADRQADMNMRGVLSDSALEAGQRAAAELVAAIDAQLAASDEPDPLEGVRDDPRAGWEALSMPRRRAVVQALLASVTIHQTRRGGRFDPSAVKMPLNPGIAE